MKVFTQGAAIAAALTVFASASSAAPADTAPASPTGHYEWRAQPNFGPRAPTRGPIRIWISDTKAKVANCDCAVTRGSAVQSTDCMTMLTKGRAAAQG